MSTSAFSRVVDEDDAVGAERGDLPAELGADRAARAGDEDGLAGDVRGDRGEVELDGLAPEHVLHLHLAELAREVEVAGDELVHGGQGLDRDADVAALVHDPLPRLARRGRDRDDDLVRAVVAKEVRQVVGRTEHPDPVEAQVLLARDRRRRARSACSRGSGSSASRGGSVGPRRRLRRRARPCPARRAAAGPGARRSSARRGGCPRRARAGSASR